MIIKSTVLVATALALLSSTASATIVTETFTGNVSGRDYGGYFGTAGAFISSTYSAVYVFDTTLGN